MRRDAERFGLVLLPERRAAPAAPPPPGENDSAPSPSDNSGPSWPDDAAESAFLAESAGAYAGGATHGGSHATTTAAATAEATEAAADANAKLPPLEALVARIPPETRQVLEDLFRARFVAVKKIPRQAMKNGEN
jgi:hypothetical protein